MASDLSGRKLSCTHPLHKEFIPIQQHLVENNNISCKCFKTESTPLVY